MKSYGKNNSKAPLKGSYSSIKSNFKNYAVFFSVLELTPPKVILIFKSNLLIRHILKI